MKKPLNNATASRDGRKSGVGVSKLGKELRKISDKFFESGEKPLTRREIEREVAERRGAG